MRSTFQEIQGRTPSIFRQRYPIFVYRRSHIINCITYMSIAWKCLMGWAGKGNRERKKIYHWTYAETMGWGASQDSKGEPISLHHWLPCGILIFPYARDLVRIDYKKLKLSLPFPQIPPKPKPKECTKPEPFHLESLERHEEEMRREIEERQKKELEEAQMRLFKAQPVLKE